CRQFGKDRGLIAASAIDQRNCRMVSEERGECGADGVAGEVGAQIHIGNVRGGGDVEADDGIAISFKQCRDLTTNAAIDTGDDYAWMLVHLNAPQSSVGASRSPRVPPRGRPQ